MSAFREKLINKAESNLQIPIWNNNKKIGFLSLIKKYDAKTTNPFILCNFNIKNFYFLNFNLNFRFSFPIFIEENEPFEENLEDTKKILFKGSSLDLSGLIAGSHKTLDPIIQRIIARILVKIIRIKLRD